MIYPSPLSDRLVFRPLRADEIEVRSFDTNGKAKLLLYKNARVDMNILDESVGPLNWQKKYTEAAGLLFCEIGIYDHETHQWIWKSDTGSKSNIEEDKGLASDAFKRAAVSWGIGRELYTAPNILIEVADNDLLDGRFCQTFIVSEIEVKNGAITKLTIIDRWGKTRYSYPSTVVYESTMTASSFTNTSSAPSHKKNKNEAALYDYCERKKATVSGEQREELDKFYTFFMTPDEDNPSESKIAKWKYLDPERLWIKWLENSKKFKK